MKEKKQTNNTVWRIIRSALLLFFVTVTVFLVCCAMSGLPQWLVGDVTNRMSQGDFLFCADGIRLDLVNGIVLKNVKIYRKKIVGPPCVDAGIVIVGVNPFACISGDCLLRRVYIADGTLRPSMLFGSEKKGKSIDLNLNTRINVERCSLLGLTLLKAECDISTAFPSLNVNNITGVIGTGDNTGEFAGRATFDMKTKHFESRINTMFDPHIILPLIESCNMNFVADLVRRFEFKHSAPRCELTISKTFTNNAPLKVSGNVLFRDGKYRDQDVMMANGNVNVVLANTNATVTVEPLIVSRKEGNAWGGLKIDFDSQSVSFDAVSTIAPVAMCRMIGVLTNIVGSTFTFEGTTKVSARGHVNYKDLSNIGIQGDVSGHTVALKQFKANDYSLKLSVKGRECKLSDIKGSFLNGKLEGDVDITVPKDADPLLDVAGRVYGVDLKKLMPLISKDKSDVDGTFLLKAGLKCSLGDNLMSTLAGVGSLRITEGKVFQFPIFGGLSKIMIRIIPGLNFVLSQSDFLMKFTVGSGKLHSDEIRVLGDVLSLSGSGDYYFDKRLDMAVQVKLMRDSGIVQKIIRGITWPISKFLEFRLTGTLDDPKWVPFSSTVDFLKKFSFTKEE